MSNKLLKADLFNELFKALFKNKPIKKFISNRHYSKGQLIQHTSNNKTRFFLIIKSGSFKIPNTENCYELSIDNIFDYEKLKKKILNG